MIAIIKLKAATRAALRDINALSPQLSPSATPITLKTLQHIIKDQNNEFLVLLDGKRIVGMGALVALNTVIHSRARLEDVVVDAQYRGRGLGERLVRRLISLARKRKIRTLELSTRATRLEANGLYQKLGFERYETNVYKIKLHGLTPVASKRNSP